MEAACDSCILLHDMQYNKHGRETKEAIGECKRCFNYIIICIVFCQHDIGWNSGEADKSVKGGEIQLPRSQWSPISRLVQYYLTRKILNIH